jgi:hypothetical protein
MSTAGPVAASSTDTPPCCITAHAEASAFPEECFTKPSNR